MTTDQPPQGSKVLVILKTGGNLTITQSPPGADFSLWCGGRIIAQGGHQLISSLFIKELSREPHH